MDDAWAARGSSLLSQARRVLASPWVRLAFLALSLAFMGAVLRTYWADMRSFRPTLHAPWLVLSFAALLPCLLLEVALWRSLLSGLGHTLAPRRAAGVWFVSSLARYVPGNVWQFLGMMELGAASDIPRGAIIASVALHQVLSNTAGIVVGASALVSALSAGRGATAAGAAIILVAVSVALSPRVLARVGRFLLPVVKPPSGRLHLSSGRLLATFLGYCFYWLWLGSAFWALGRGLGAASGGVLGWASAFSASYVAGYLSLLTPSGMGVREGVLALLLATVAGPGVAGVAALAARLWLTVAELLAAGAMLVADRSLLWSPRRRTR